VTTRLPLFPLNTVLFPGVTTPLHVFEDRYRAMVRDLVAIEDPAQRLIGITAIREGYEVGDTVNRQGLQSLHTMGTVMQLVDVDPYGDGRYDIELVGRQRFRLHDVETDGEYAVGLVDLVGEPDDSGAQVEADRTLATFEVYRQRLSEMRGDLVLAGDMPTDPTYLSWSLASTCLLTQAERQALLESPDAASRLALLRRSLISEMQAMKALPSLPATGVARMRWSPN
jgi:Lon protease-like protein